MASPVEIVVRTLARHGISHSNMTAMASDVFSDLRSEGYTLYFEGDVQDLIQQKAKELVEEVKDAVRAKIADFESREFSTVDLKPADKP